METVKKNPKISDYPTTIESPFTVEITTKQFAPNTEHKVVTDDDGVAYAMYEIPKNKTVMHDPAAYCKHYKGTSNVLMALKEPANKMYYYIHEHLDVNRDEICILMDDYLLFAGYKASNRLNYYRAIEGLLAANIIARKVGMGSCFYINPNIIFNGDRTKLKNVVSVNNHRSALRLSGHED
jgi:hypothetical protein